MIEYLIPFIELGQKPIPWWSADRTFLYSVVGLLPNGKKDRRCICGRELRHATMLEF